MEWTDDTTMEAARLWAAGKSASEIAKAIGVSRSAVMGKVDRNRDIFQRRVDAHAGSATKGLRPKRVPFWTPERMEIAERMWVEGRTGAEIGDAVGARRNIVLAMMTKNRKRFPKRGREKTKSKVRLAVIETPPVCAPIRYEDAIDQNRCLYFHGDPMGPSGPDMLVCGEVVDRHRWVTEHLRWCPWHAQQVRRLA